MKITKPVGGLLGPVPAIRPSPDNGSTANVSDDPMYKEDAAGFLKTASVILEFIEGVDLRLCRIELMTEVPAREGGILFSWALSQIGQYHMSTLLEIPRHRTWKLDRQDVHESIRQEGLYCEEVQMVQTEPAAAADAADAEAEEEDDDASDTEPARSVITPPPGCTYSEGMLSMASFTGSLSLTVILFVTCVGLPITAISTK